MSSLPNTEFTVEVKSCHFKVSLRKLDDDSIVIILTEVTNLINIQSSISQSLRLKGMGTFVAGIAHEIKNPLVAVKTFTQLLSMDWSNSEIRKKCYDVVLPQLYRIDDLSKSLSHLGINKKSTYKPLDIEILFNKIINLVKDGDYYNQKIKIQLKCDSKIMIFVSEQLFIQAILNILINVLDALQSQPNPIIIIRIIGASKSLVCIEIEDNGLGISDEDIDFLFDPFFTTKDTGTGLGLSIVHQIILDHQGKIVFEKGRQKGAKLTITLPVIMRPKPGTVKKMYHAV